MTELAHDGDPAARDVLTLMHLHATGEDCVDAEEKRTPWRRWMRHCTFYGFALCFASTTVAAIYHIAGWTAPYAYTRYAAMPTIATIARNVSTNMSPS